MENNFKIVCSGFIKFFILVLLALLFLSIVYSVTYYDISHTGVISDSSLTEALQESLLFSSICIYVYIIRRYYAKGLILVAGFLFVCLLGNGMLFLIIFYFMVLGNI